MAVHKLLLNDFIEEEEFFLIGIHCTIEDYRLAYLLNKSLEIKLERQDQDLDFIEANYSIFEWENKSQLTKWNLVSNTYKIEIENRLEADNLSTLFDSKQSGTKTYHLIPEFKKVNYFLKISDELNQNKEKFILNKILGIPQIVTAYSVATDKLKSKNNLIFN